MFGKKILIFALFGIMVFAGSLAAMLMIGKFVKGPEASVNIKEAGKPLSSEASEEAAKISNINKIIENMYYKQTDGLYDYKTQSNETSMLLNNIKPAKLIDEISKLKEKYESKNLELRGKEEQLNSLKNELASEREKIDLIKKDMEKNLDMINQTRQSIHDSLAVMDGEEADNMKLLANIYEGMKPAQAASIISKMDHRTAVKLLKLMDQRNSAKILQDVEPATAVKLSEQIRGGKVN